MRYALPIVLAVMLALVGCTQQSDQEQVDAALQDHPFFRSLGAVPAANDEYTGRGGTDGDTTWPVDAWRVVPEPEISYNITVSRPFANVDFHIVWPCTLFVVYTDLPDTSIRDTVVKPAPEVNGSMSARFEFNGNDWELTDLSPCDAEFDSAFGVIEIDSIQVSVHRDGAVIDYPTLDNTGLLPLNPYAYTFEPGDSVELRLWETHTAGIEFAWAYLHGPPGHWYSPFELDPSNDSWTGTWVVNPTETADDENWVWFEVIDLNDAVLNKNGPDRSVLWGIGYIVE